MDTQYIVLDGSTAELSTDNQHLTWHLGDYYFNDLRSEEKLMLEMTNVEFIGSSTLEDYVLDAVDVYANINIRNQRNTANHNGYSLLGSVRSDYVVEEESNGIVTSVMTYAKHPEFVVDKFNDITIYCYHHSNSVKLEYLNKNYCKFVLRITKVKN